MNKKCDKYESLFIFRDSDEFKAHLLCCEECREKHSEMMKIDTLIRTAKPAYLRSKSPKKFHTLNKAFACFAFLVCLSFVSGNYSEIQLFQQNLKHPEVSEYVNNSIFNRMKLPTDEYGLLDPNKELVYE